MIVVFALVMVAGFGGMVLASRRAVASATELAAGTNLPPFFVGMTLLAVGTDLPEIANSIVASLADHGDVNVGDSVGSTATQATLVLGLLPLVAGAIPVPRRGIASTGGFAVVGLAIVAIATTDDHLGRIDGLVLMSVWVIGSVVIYRQSIHEQQLALPEQTRPRPLLIAHTLAAMGVVAGAAMVSLWGIIGIADELDAPEFLVSFFLASIGTSLPEFVVDITALRKGATALAIGDVLGSSFVDATLSIGIGPVVSPTAVTSSEIGPAVVAALVAMVIVTVVMARVRSHDWRTGAILLAIYAGFFVALL